MKLYNVLSYLFACSIAVKAVEFPPSRFPFKDKMATQDIPQFITITLDDGITLDSYNNLKKFILDIQDSRGCKPRVTHFTSFDWAPCGAVKAMYDSGVVEQGHHTGMHTGRPTAAQIKSAMDQLVGCGVPASAVTGFRTPYLDYDSTTLVSLSQLKVVYDTTIIQDDDVASGYGANNTWPFTLEKGFTGSIKCGVTGSCINQPYPNMWEIPMYRWYSKSNAVLNDIMDYATFSADVDQMFNRHYNGNRAPFGIYVHHPWLANNGAALKAWIQKIMATYTDVYFVANMDLLEWMQNPVPKSTYTCKPPGSIPTVANQTTTPVNQTTTPVNQTTTPVNQTTTPVNQTTTGCCSHDFKTCITWYGCGTTESQCLACGTKSDPTIWLASGALTSSTCFARWSGYGCTSNSVCCPGLVCMLDEGGIYKACLPGNVITPTNSTSTPAPIPVGGQCGSTTKGVQFGLNCISKSYCIWGTANKQTCRSCKRAPLNAFDCQNYRVACGPTTNFAVCATVRKLRGVNGESV